jgi:rhodanese-related sulfurtransferase
LLECDRPNCNNFLTDQQVACVLTYRRLWQTIADGPDARVLVREDDVFFHEWTPRVLAWLEQEVKEGRIPFAAGTRLLLRLGWAFGHNHNGTARIRAKDVLRMANPCHALTRDFAQALVDLVAHAPAISQTADAFQHELAPQPGEALTVFPPIASDLSWTEGRFASTIHPKDVRVKYLKAHGRETEAAAAAAALAGHVRKKVFRPLLIAGHPRTGTGYAAALCRQLGVDVGHEKLGASGISSWMFAVDAEANP